MSNLKFFSQVFVDIQMQKKQDGADGTVVRNESKRTHTHKHIKLLFEAVDSAPETRRGHVSTGADAARQVGDVCLQPLAGLTSKNGHVRFLAKKKPPLQETLYKVEVSV